MSIIGLKRMEGAGYGLSPIIERKWGRPANTPKGPCHVPTFPKHA